jgi:hypothetical protein
MRQIFVRPTAGRDRIDPLDRQYNRRRGYRPRLDADGNIIGAEIQCIGPEVSTRERHGIEGDERCTTAHASR